jgi:hypothetical protein
MNHTNHPRHLNEEQPQPQQALDPTTRTEENNRETTKNNTGVRNSEPPNKPKKQPNTIIIRKSEF